MTHVVTQKEGTRAVNDFAAPSHMTFSRNVQVRTTKFEPSIE